MTTLPTIDLDFTSPPPIPDAAVVRVNELLASGRLFRYGETGAGELDVAELETAFARLLGRRYCIAFNSCGASLAASLMALGLRPGAPVLMNAFTLAPVPGAIVHAGGEPVFVGITPDYEIDLEDLRRAAERSGARFLMLSHMRGHIGDMDRLMAVATDLKLTVIEDCAHTMGAGWDGRPSGTFGAVGCFSTQTFKHVNSGEGGLLVTDDDDAAARAILLSGSYMLHAQHGTRPPPEVIERHRYTTPNLSMRMSAVAAAIALPQLGLLEQRTTIWNERYGRLAELLDADPLIRVPPRRAEEQYVASSIQFSVDGLETSEMRAWLAVAEAHGVHVKWFGQPEPVGFTSRYDHWHIGKLGASAGEQTLLATTEVLQGLCDMRIPLTMSLDDCEVVAEIIRGALETTLRASQA